MRNSAEVCGFPGLASRRSLSRFAPSCDPGAISVHGARRPCALDPSAKSRSSRTGVTGDEQRSENRRCPSEGHSQPLRPGVVATKLLQLGRRGHAVVGLAPRRSSPRHAAACDLVTAARLFSRSSPLAGACRLLHRLANVVAQPWLQWDAVDGDWVLLAYRLPRDPSTPRIAVWRKLKRLGVAQLVDGLVALPRDSRTQEAFEWLAEEIVEAGGEATVWTGSPASRAHERALARQLAAARAEEYRQVVTEARAAYDVDARTRRRTLARLRRELHRIRRRDYFPPPERREAEAAVADLGREINEVAA